MFLTSYHKGSTVVIRLKIQQAPIDKLTPWDGNPRKNDKAVAAVAKSIKRFGFNVPILCDGERGIIAGHTRLEAAKRLGMKMVPIICLPLGQHERRLFAIADNRTGELADWDTPKLKEILDELHSEDVDLSALGFPARELRRLLKVEREREENLPEPPVRARTTPGTLWKLGRHRLLCGDSRYKTTSARLLGKTKVDHVFASPPYFNQRAYAHWDNYTKYLRDMGRVMANCFAALKDGGVIVWNIGNGASTHHAHVIHHASMLEENNFRFLDMIIWVKPEANYGVARNVHIRRSARYFPAPRWEALLAYQRSGKMPNMTAEGVCYMSKHHTDVWTVPIVRRQMHIYGHPAVCPVEIPVRTIEAYTGEGASLLEPFGGSGTTLIAAEQTGRRAFLIERLPRYCDAILKRWEEYSGKRARRSKD